MDLGMDEEGAFHQKCLYLCSDLASDTLLGEQQFFAFHYYWHRAKVTSFLSTFTKAY